MKTILIAATALTLVAAPAAFAQSYGGPQYSAVGGGAAGSGSSVNGIVDNGVGGVVGATSNVVDGATNVVGDTLGGVAGVVGGVVAVPGALVGGQGVYAPVGYGYPQSCTVIGGGAVGTCNSLRR